MSPLKIRAGDDKERYCLEISGVGPDNKKQYTGVLYFKDLKNYQEEYIPVFDKLLFGYEKPEEIIIDTRNGNIYSRSKNNVWLIQPWSLEIWRKKACDVLQKSTKPSKYIEPTRILEYIVKKIPKKIGVKRAQH